MARAAVLGGGFKNLPLAELKSHSLVIGSKQVKKALNKGIVQKVFLASDAEPRVIEPLQLLCHQHRIEVVMVETMKLLGDACGIDVGSAAVAIIN
ncbi:MAG TPA: ribosomal L7Ae/L30e/S12e/Gadd45 family protein [Syntrophomonadaceae bacterium]|nr:ribosomal L7Ae/L30e/S12e/Gadd45 family protein [Syntrophomonadaceae bacterium]